MITRSGLDELIALLSGRGYTVVGPTVRDGAIVYEEVSSSADLPGGWTDEQDGGTYRLRGATTKRSSANNGPNS